MIWAAMLGAFFVFLRISEFTSTHVRSYNPYSTLCVEDVQFMTDNRSNVIRVSINIKASKTDPFRTGMTIRLSQNASILCPVTALVQFMDVHPYKAGPLFTSQDGRYLTRKEVNKVLSNAVCDIPGHFSTHSFRIGAASTAAAAGYPRWLIQTLGRWASNCYQRYIRVADSTIDAVSKALIVSPSYDTGFDPDNLNLY